MFTEPATGVAETAETGLDCGGVTDGGAVFAGDVARISDFVALPLAGWKFVQTICPPTTNTTALAEMVESIFSERRGF